MTAMCLPSPAGCGFAADCSLCDRSGDFGIMNCIAGFVGESGDIVYYLTCPCRKIPSPRLYSAGGRYSIGQLCGAKRGDSRLKR